MRAENIPVVILLIGLPSLKVTVAPENEWLEDDPFRSKLAVSFEEGYWIFLKMNTLVLLMAEILHHPGCMKLCI